MESRKKIQRSEVERMVTVFYVSMTDGEYIVVIEGKGTAGERQYVLSAPIKLILK